MKTIDKKPAMRSMLEHSFLLQELPSCFAQFIYDSPGCECVLFESGEAIYTREHYRHSIAMLFSGSAVAYKNHGGSEAVAINYFHPGSVFGVASVFSSSNSYVSEIIAEKKCRVLFLSQSLLSQLFMKEPQVAENYIRYLSGRINFLNQKIDAFTAGSAEKKVSFYLAEQMERLGSPVLELTCSLTRLSSVLDVARASLYRALNQLEEQQIIRREGKIIEILRPEALLL